MTQEKIYYTLICDECGASFEEEYDDVDQAEEVAIASGWAVLDGKHYCPDCHHGYEYEKDRFRV